MARMEMVGCLPKLQAATHTIEIQYNTLQYLVRDGPNKGAGWAFLSLFLCFFA